MSDKNSPPRSYRYFDMVMALFVTVLIVSNIASSAKIIDLSFSIFQFRIPMAFDAGTLLFPISYIFGDVLTEVYGYKRSQRVIWTGFACLALTSLVFGVIRSLPGDAVWEGYAGQTAYDQILSGISSGGIVLASLLGYWAGAFSNAFVMARMKLWTNGRKLWLRTISSTLVGEGFDTLFFVLVATIAGVFPWELFTILLFANYVFKVLVEALMTPVTYLVVNSLKKVEGEDYYDYRTDFSPFRG